jgi:hypothetical protein
LRDGLWHHVRLLENCEIKQLLPEPPALDPDTCLMLCLLICARHMTFAVIRVVDGSRFDEFKGAVGVTLVCGFCPH